MNAATLGSALSALKADYHRRAGERDLLLRRRAATQAELLQAQADVEQWEFVAQLLTLVSEASREQVRARIEATVTAALQATFGEGLSFKVAIGSIGGQPSVAWNVESLYGDMLLTSGVEDAKGGGVVDVISLALRLALLELYKPKLGGALVLDEPGRCVSAEYAINLARFLQAYSQETGRQILMITHNSALAEFADRSFRVVLRNGVSEVTQG